MGRSLGLTLYRFARGRGTAAAPVGVNPALKQADIHRPPGLLILLNAPNIGAARALSDLVRRIKAERDGLHFLITTPPDLSVADANFPHGTLFEHRPAETGPMVRSFLDRWHPDLAVFAEGMLPIMLVDQAHSRGVSLLLVDGRPDKGSRSWFPWSLGLTRSVLQQFDRILVHDAAAARQFRRMGAPAWRLEVAGKLEQSAGALPCTEAERDAMAGFLRSRPIWLAVAVPELEELSVITALRQALRLSHRLLLILVPEDPSRGPALADLIVNDLALNASVRSRDEDPDQEDQIYIADTEGEFGLWYRLAPVTYMGGTLLGGAKARHPYEPAALGSAILHGPLVGDKDESYARLNQASAARLVRNALELGEAVSDLMAPDKAALMAHNAWAASTSGAEVTDRVVRLILDTLATRTETKSGPAKTGPARPGSPRETVV